MTTTSSLTTARNWYRWNSNTGLWEPTIENKRPDWENAVVCQVMRPDAKGVSQWVSTEELAEFYENFNHTKEKRAIPPFGKGNGSDFFTRKDYGSYEFIQEKRPKHRRDETRFNGLRNDIALTNQVIPVAVRRVITAQDCAFTGLRGIDRVVDHKDGRHNTASDSVDDYQSLTGPINKLKGSHCSRCISTNQRFDARSLGYAIGWVHGNGTYQGTCVGCYWHDIHHFRSTLTLPQDHEP